MQAGLLAEHGFAATEAGLRELERAVTLTLTLHSSWGAAPALRCTLALCTLPRFGNTGTLFSACTLPGQHPHCHAPPITPSKFPASPRGLIMFYLLGHQVAAHMGDDPAVGARGKALMKLVMGDIWEEAD